MSKLSQALQYALFQGSFERGEGDGLIGGPPSPEQDSNEIVVPMPSCSQALQCVLIPLFQVSFERDEGDLLIGGPPSPLNRTVTRM